MMLKMKTTNIYKKYKRVSSVGMAVFLGLTGVLSSCEDNYDFKPDFTLERTRTILPDSACSTRIMIYANGGWEADFANESVEWLRIDQASGGGDGYMVVSLDSNKVDLARQVKLTVRSSDKVDTICIAQRGVNPLLDIDVREIRITSEAGEQSIPMLTNMPYEAVKFQLAYSDDKDWIKDIQYADGTIRFQVDENSSTDGRKADFIYEYMDAVDTKVVDTLTLVQYPEFNVKGAVEKSFDFVRSLNEGDYYGNFYIKGIIVSDKNNRNNAKVNEKGIKRQNIAYIQSLDGTMGYRLVTETEGDNNFERFDTVHLWLSNTTIRKYENPERYEIANVKLINKLYESKGESPAIQPREVYIKDLKDQDIYTYIKLKDVEIAIPFGTYANQHLNYAGKVGYFAPCLIRDIQGSHMYMLNNVDKVATNKENVSWQVKPLPKGSGTISGVIVYEEVNNYGDELGSYFIRPLKEEEIALEKERDNGFSTVLAEWSEHPFKTSTDANAVTQYVNAETGKGKISHSDHQFKKIRVTSAFSAEQMGYIGYNLDYTKESADHTVVGNDLRAGNWWPTGKARGGWWQVEISTTGITQQLSLQLDANSFAYKHNGRDVAGPCHFAIEWSTSGGEDASRWNHITDYDCIYQAQWSYFRPCMYPGFKSYNFNLPTELLGKERVFIRLRVKDTKTPWGRFANAMANDISHLSIKYNK